MNSLMISATIVVAVVALFAWQGYRKGALLALRGLLGSFAGYLAAYTYTASFAQLIQQFTALNILSAFALASVLLFLSVSIITNLLLTRLRNMLVTLHEGDEEHDTSLGIAAGVAAGIFVALLLVWMTGLSLDAMRIRDGGNVLPDATSDPVRHAAGQMVGGVVSYAVEQKVGRDSVAPELAGELVVNPVAVGQQLTQLSRSEGVRTLFTDPALQDLLAHDKVDQLRQQPAFRQLMQDPAISQLLAGMSEGTNPSVSPDKEKAVATLLASLWRKGERMKADPRFNAIVQKPEVQALLANPSPLALLGNHDIQILAQIAFTGSDAPASNPAPPVTTQLVNNTPGTPPVDAPKVVEAPKTVEVQKAENLATPVMPVSVSPNLAIVANPSPAAQEPQAIYRWVDKNGQTHYGEKKPEGSQPVQTLDLK
jgi:uncharacterized membrane protein required for colicin V production